MLLGRNKKTYSNKHILSGAVGGYSDGRKGVMVPCNKCEQQRLRSACTCVNWCMYQSDSSHA